MHIFTYLSAHLYAYNLEKKNIMVLHSYHKGLEWTDNVMAGIEAVFHNSKYDVVSYGIILSDQLETIHFLKL